MCSFFFTGNFAHLMAVMGWMKVVIEAGLVCQAQHLPKDISGVMLENGVEEKVTQSTVFLSLVLAEVHEPLDVKVGSDELNVLGAQNTLQMIYKKQQ